MILLLLAFVQSATEFLPVSSSGHLLFLKIVGLSNQSLYLDMALHLGTLGAVICYFHKDIGKLFHSLFIPGGRHLLKLLITASLPIIIAGMLLIWCHIGDLLRHPACIIASAFIWGLALYAIDKHFPRRKTINHMTLRDAVYIGTAQILALIPGTSRSGITMTMARALGFNRTESARFSMLLSIPTIFCGAVGLWLHALHTQHTESLSLLGLGVLYSFIFGFIAIWFLMRWLKHASFKIFAVYRCLFAVVLLLWLFTH